MTSNYKTDIVIRAGSYTESIYKSILVDNQYYTGPPDSINITYDNNDDDSGNGSITITVTAGRVAHMRAGINSILRLAQVSHDTLKTLHTPEDTGTD